MSLVKNIAQIQAIIAKQKNPLVLMEMISPICAQIFKANRVVVQRTVFDEMNKEYYFEFFSEWVDEDTPQRFMGDRRKRRFYFTKGPMYQKFLETMGEGHPVVLRGEMLDFLKKNAKETMQDVDFKSALVLPLKTGSNEIWGNITFHALEDETVYDDLEKYQDTIVIITALLENSFIINKFQSEQTDILLDDHSMRMASLGRIAAGIAHEINNPMFIIGGFATRIEQIIDDDEFDENKEDIKTFLEMIEKNCKRVTDIIAGLRMMARDASKDDFEVVDAKEILRQTVDISRERLQLEKIRIDLECGSGEFLVECKPGQLMQVVSNLIGNSCDSLSSTKDGDWIKIVLAKDSGNVLIKIIDAGRPLDQELAEQIMEPFFTTKEASKGTGLGLSISKEIIKRFDGEFFLDQSCENVCFVISLPEINFDDE